MIILRRFKLSVCGVLTFVLGSSFAVAVEPQPTAETIVIENRPLISGLWSLHTANMRCAELYNFRENGTFLIQSGGEWTLGQYDYALPAQGDEGLPVLTMKILYDNNQTDCSGNQIDQSHETQQQFVRVSVDHRQMQFCGTAEGQQCELALQRVLP